MTAPMIESADNSLQARAVRTACEVAEMHRLAFSEPIVLSHQSNVLVHLRPTAAVARVATTTAVVRRGDAWLAREVAVAQHLAAAGAPVVPVSTELPPGPHRHNGFALSFWEFVETIGGTIDPRASGRALRACHDALADFRGALPVLGCLTEAADILARLDGAPELADMDIDLLRRIGARVHRRLEERRLPTQPLHGDAHLANVLNTARGPLWSDWEDTFRGPVAWDLACLVANARVFGTESAQAAAALAAHGASVDAECIDLLVDARVFQAAIWSVLIMRQRPYPRERLTRRLQWLRARDAEVY